jgi:LPS-assembly protein
MHPFVVPRPLRVALLAALSAMASASVAHAQSQTPQPAAEAPTFVVADRLEGITERELEATGNAEVHKGELDLYADRILYQQDSDEAEASGNVRMLTNGNEVTGPRARMRLNDSTGIFDEPVFKLAPREVHDESISSSNIRLNEPATQVIEMRGDGKAFRLEGTDQYRLTDGRFTSCKPGQDDWYVNAEELRIDMDRQVASAHGASLSFLGVTTPEVSWFDFSLNNTRKSGFLPPSVGVSGKNGPEFLQPYYWNIAPNYDATITPRYMAKRGLQLLTEFRYLQPQHAGEFNYEILPNDSTAEGNDRYGISWHNISHFGNGLTGYVNWNRVSDDDYFRDLSGRLSIATQTYLPRDAYLSYSRSNDLGNWSGMARVQRFQTLQDPLNPLPIPYERAPQLTFNYSNQDVRYMDLGVASELVAFDHPTLLNGRRGTLYPSIALPISNASAYVKPKVGIHSTWYNLDDPVRDDERTPTRFVPIASIDSGLNFERDASLSGRDWVQTLEPRLYYLYVPYRDQTDLPQFDSGLADLNFAQIFSENAFTGGDRIAEANQLTAAVTSRLIDPNNGQEVFRALVGQRYYFSQQRVTLQDGVSGRRDSSESALLGAMSGRVSRDWAVDSAIQYAMKANEVERFNAGVRYSPAPASVANVTYRYTNANQTTIGAINSIDVSAQWPLARNWYGLGRVNWDIDGGKAVEQLAGLEYNAGCWVLRLAYHQFQTSTSQQTSLFFLQIELNGFSSVGSNPISTLRNNIPGYMPSNFINASRGNAFDNEGAVSPW